MAWAAEFFAVRAAVANEEFAVGGLGVVDGPELGLMGY